MSVTLQNEKVLFTGKDAFSYVYQANKSGNRLISFFKGLLTMRKVEVSVDDVNMLLQIDSSKSLGRKFQSMKVRLSIAFPLTRTAFDMMSNHRYIPCKEANNISQFLADFCPKVERGKHNLTEMVKKLDELHGLVKAFEQSVTEMDDQMFRFAFRTVGGKKEQYLEESSKPFDPDEDFSVKRYRQTLLEMLEGQLVQFTSKVISNIDALSIKEGDRPESDQEKNRHLARDSDLLTKRVDDCSPERAIARLGASISTEQMDKALQLDKTGEAFSRQLDEWINAYEAVERYRKFASCLHQCHFGPFKEKGQCWQQAIKSVISAVDDTFSALSLSHDDRIKLFEAVVKRCQANGNNEGAMIKAAKQWLSQAQADRLHAEQLRMKEQLEVVETIEQVIIETLKSLDRSNNNTEVKYFSENQLGRIKAALERWQRLETWSNFLSVRNNLIELLEEVKQSNHLSGGPTGLRVHKLRELFPIDESGAFTEVQTNGKKRRVPDSEYKGRLSRQLRAVIEHVHSKGSGSGVTMAKPETPSNLPPDSSEPE